MNLFDVLIEASFLAKQLDVLRKHDLEAQRRVDLMHQRADALLIVRPGRNEAG